MSDPALQWLLENIKQDSSNTSLWFIDENADESIFSLNRSDNIRAISNRQDIAAQLQGKGWNAEFNDFNLDTIATAGIDAIFYRISKEKAVTHHLLNQAWRCLKPNGKLYLCGQKNEGIKTYIDKITECFGCAKNLRKLGSAYVSCLEKETEFNVEEALDDSQYPELRPLLVTDNLQILTKPGQFGWNKLDQGSAFLIAELPAILEHYKINPHHGLDLGCGYGYLSLMASRLPACQSIQDWLLTDNNAAAIRSATANVMANQLNAQVIADDCAAGIANKVDLLLCNPPFHQGFSVEGELTDKFLKTARRLITNTGLAVFVVNQFIPLERKAQALFRQVDTVASNGSFKLVVLKA